MFFDALPPAQVCEVRQDLAYDLSSARAARLAGDYATAGCVLRVVLAEQSENADAWVELGHLQSTSGENDQARMAFERALTIAPDYDDAKIGLARLAYRAGDLPQARRRLMEVSASRRAGADISALLDALHESEHVGAAPWRVDAFASYSALSSDQPDWREVSLALSRRNAAWVVGLNLQWQERFDLEDLYGQVRVARSWDGHVLGLAIGAADHAYFRPEAALAIDYSSPEDQSIFYGASASIARYKVGQIDSVSVRVGKQLGQSWSVHALGVAVQDEMGDTRAGYGLGGRWRTSPRSRWDLNWVDAPESSEGITVDVRAASLALTHEVQPGHSVRLGLMHEMRDAFDRTELTLGVSRTF